MKFTLTRFGSEEVEIDPQTILTFPRGLPPFEDCTHYKLFHEEGKPSVFWLQSLDDPAILFSVADPALLNIAYEVMLSDEEQALLQAVPGDDLILAVILFKSGDQPSINANTRAPIIINTGKRIGLQKLLHEFEAQVSIRGS